MNATLLTVSIIVHDDFSHIAHALSSLYEQTHLPMTIYVTVNTGNINSINQLKQQFPKVHYLINDTPHGFAYNHDQVLRIAETDYVAILNDDVLVGPSMVERIIAFMSDHPKVGFASFRVLNRDGTPQLVAFSDPTVLRMIYCISGLGYFTQHGGRARGILMRLGISQRLRIASLDSDEGSRFVPVVVGVAMFVRRAAYEQAGVMDEATLVYGEEYAWQLANPPIGMANSYCRRNSVIIHHNEAPRPFGLEACGAPKRDIELLCSLSASLASTCYSRHYYFIPTVFAQLPQHCLIEAKVVPNGRQCIWLCPGKPLVSTVSLIQIYNRAHFE